MKIVELTGHVGSIPLIHAANVVFLQQTAEVESYFGRKSKEYDFWEKTNADFRQMVDYMREIDDTAGTDKLPYVERAYRKICDLQNRIDTAIKVATEDELEELRQNLGQFTNALQKQREAYDAVFACSKRIGDGVKSFQLKDTLVGATVFAVSCMCSRRAMEVTLVANAGLQLINMGISYYNSRYTDNQHFNNARLGQIAER